MLKFKWKQLIADSQQNRTKESGIANKSTLRDTLLTNCCETISTNNTSFVVVACLSLARRRFTNKKSETENSRIEISIAAAMLIYIDFFSFSFHATIYKYSILIVFQTE